MAQQVSRLWQQIVICILLAAIGGSLGIYIYAQRQYTLLREKDHQQNWDFLQTAKQQFLDAAAQAGTSPSLNLLVQNHVKKDILHIFEQSPQLFRVTVLDPEGHVFFVKELPEVTTYFQSISSFSQGSPAATSTSFALVYEHVQIIQFPLIFRQRFVGFLRGEFWPTDSGSQLVQLTKLTLEIIIIAIVIMIVLGGSLIFTQITSHLSSKQQRLEEYAVSLERANERLQRTRKELQISEKLASLGYLAAGIAHEIGNPLGAVLGYIELLQKDHLEREKSQDVLQRTQHEIERIRRILQELVHFSRPHSMRIQTLDVNTLVNKTVSQFPPFPGKAIDVKIKLTTFPLWADVDGQKLQSVFYNILCNAVDAIAASGRIRILTSRRIRESSKIIGGSEVIAIQISDTGEGISEEDLSKIFEPFYTTKDPGKGMGLGLSLCHRIIESLNGEIAVQSVYGKGTDVTVFLPPARKRKEEQKNGRGEE